MRNGSYTNIRDIINLFTFMAIENNVVSYFAYFKTSDNWFIFSKLFRSSIGAPAAGPCQDLTRDLNDSFSSYIRRRPFGKLSKSEKIALNLVCHQYPSFVQKPFIVFCFHIEYVPRDTVLTEIV